MDATTEPAILLINKHRGPTSRDAVDPVENELGPKKVGHGGTLDPEAEGLLPILLNDATRLTEFLHDTSKTYQVKIRFDRASETLDREGDIRKIELDKKVSVNEFHKTLDKFDGEIEQIPPRFSAAKVDGTRAYELARADESFEQKAKAVRVHDIKVLSFSWPEVSIQVKSGKGFYIRSLARDIASELQLPGALVTEIRRTAYGPYSLDQAVALKEPRDWKQALLSPQTLLTGFPKFQCNDEQKRLITHGSWLPRRESSPETNWAVAVDSCDKLLALLTPATRNDKSFWWPKKVFANPDD